MRRGDTGCPSIAAILLISGFDNAGGRETKSARCHKFGVVFPVIPATLNLASCGSTREPSGEPFEIHPLIDHPSLISHIYK